MNVLLVTYEYPPVQNGGAARPAALVHALHEAGHCVHVLTRSAAGCEAYDAQHAPLGQVIRVAVPSKDESKSLLYYTDRLAHYLALRIGIFIPKLFRWVQRAKAVIHTRYRDEQWDVVIGTYPPVEGLMLAMQIAAARHIPLAVDLRDGFLFEPLEEGILRYSAARRFFKRVQLQWARQAALITTVSDPLTADMAAIVQRNGWDAAVMTIPNGFELAPPTTSPATWPHDKNPDQLHLVYTGAISNSKASNWISFKEVVLAIKYLREHGVPIRLWLAGNLVKHEQMFIQMQLGEAATLLGVLSRPMARALQQWGDVSLLTTPPGEVSIVTSKIFDYALSGRPILVYPDISAAAGLVRQWDAGWPCADTAQLTSTLHQLFEDRNALRQKTIAVDVIELYARPAQMSRYVAALSALPTHTSHCL